MIASVPFSSAKVTKKATLDLMKAQIRPKPLTIGNVKRINTRRIRTFVIYAEAGGNKDYANCVKECLEDKDMTP